jgi:hypothetical protein
VSEIRPVQQQQGCTCAFLWVFALVWLTITGANLVISWVGRGRSGAFSNLLLILFALVGLVVLGMAIRQSVRIAGKGLKFGQPEAKLSHQQVRIGESFQFTIWQPFRGSVTTNGVTLKLVLRETAIYRRRRRRRTRTYTVTHEHVASEYTHPGQAYGPGQSFYDDRTFRIPHDGMHSFIGQRNKLQWFVKVEFALARWPGVSEAYEIVVVPERVEADAYGN